MNAPRALLFLVTLTACPLVGEQQPTVDLGDNVEDTDNVAPQPTGPPCLGKVMSISPEDGAIAVSPTTDIRVTFDTAPDEDVEVELIGVDAVLMWEDLGTVAVLTPEEHLEAEADFTVRVEICDTTTTATFTTHFDPVDPASLVGRTWIVPWQTLNWTAPNSAAVFATFADFDAIMLELLDVTPMGGQLRMAGTGGYDLSTYYVPECRNTPVPSDVDFSDNPRFETASSSFAIPVDSTFTPTVIEVYETRFTGTFIEGGDAIAPFAASGLLDLRGVEVLISPVNACDLFAAAGSPCEVCPDGEIKCVWAAFDAARADWSPLSSVTEGCDP